jgi:hypothetical protein
MLLPISIRTLDSSVSQMWSTPHALPITPIIPQQQTVRKQLLPHQHYDRPPLTHLPHLYTHQNTFNYLFSSSYLQVQKVISELKKNLE